jgi:hypothetical protein
MVVSLKRGRTRAATGLQRSPVDARGLRRKLHPACALFFGTEPILSRLGTINADASERRYALRTLEPEWWSP